MGLDHVDLLLTLIAHGSISIWAFNSHYYDWSLGHITNNRVSKKRSVIVVNHHCPVDEVHALFLYMKLEWLHDMTAVGKAVLSSTTAMSIMKLSNSTIPASFSFCWNITIYDIRNNRTGDPKLPYPEVSDYLTLPNMLFLI